MLSTQHTLRYVKLHCLINVTLRGIMEKLKTNKKKKLIVHRVESIRYLYIILNTHLVQRERCTLGLSSFFPMSIILLKYMPNRKLSFASSLDTPSY